MIWKYIIRDLNGAIQYLPYGVMAGAVMGLILNAMNARRERKGKEAFPMAGLMVFSLYLMIILAAFHPVWLCVPLGISLAEGIFQEHLCGFCDQPGSGDFPAHYRQRLFSDR